MCLNNTNQEKSMKDIKRTDIEMDMVNFTIVVEEFTKVIGKITKWMDMASYFMKNLLLHTKDTGKRIVFTVKVNYIINR